MQERQSASAIGECWPCGDACGHVVRGAGLQILGTRFAAGAAAAEQAGQAVLINQLPVRMLLQKTHGGLIGLAIEQDEVGVAKVEGLLLRDGARLGDSITSLVIRSEQQVEVPVDDLHGVTGVVSTVETDGGVRGQGGECVLSPVERDDQSSVQVITVHKFYGVHRIFVPGDSETSLCDHNGGQHSGDQCSQFELEQGSADAVNPGGCGI